MLVNRKPFIVSKNRKELVNDFKAPSLLDGPPDVIRVVGSWLDTKSAKQFVKTCKTIYNFFQPNLDEKTATLVKNALHYAAFGEMKQLDELLTKSPALLYRNGTTIDACGRIIHGTVYRIALGAKDWNPFPDTTFEEMTEMIERHMKTLPYSYEEIELQKAEQFPPGWEAQEKIREENDSEELKKVFAAIDQSETNEDCKDAIQNFIHYLKSQKEVKTGYHFNDKLLSEAQDSYMENYDKFGGINSRKNRLAGIIILGSIQGRMTACLAMAHCDGLTNVTKDKRQLSRRIILDDGTRFFSPSLGSSHFIHSYWKWEGGWARRFETAINSSDLSIPCKNYLEKKSQAAANGKVPHQAIIVYER